MNLEKLSIGEMAKLNSLSTQTLRYYDKHGILKPYLIDEENGYRYYHINQCARLDMVQYLKSTGAKLDEIAEILGEHMDEASLLSLLESRLEQIEEEIKTAEQKRANIRHYIKNYEKYKKMYFENSIFLEYIPKRYIYSYKTDMNLFEEGSVAYEMMMRELKTLFYKEHFPLCYFCNVGTIVRHENVKAERLFSDEVFVFVENDFEGKAESLDENWYVCVCSKEFDDEVELAQSLFAYIKDKGYEIVGDYLCEVILDFPDFRENPRKLFYKIQIPISKQ